MTIFNKMNHTLGGEVVHAVPRDNKKYNLSHFTIIHYKTNAMKLAVILLKILLITSN